MRPLLALSAALALVALPGCSCGSYSAKTGMSLDDVSLDREDYFEECGPTVGVWGDIDMMGDGLAWFTFTPSHANEDVDWAAISITMDLFFPNTQLVAGTHVTDFTGGADVTDMAGNHYAVAGLTAATVDVLDVRDPDEECAPFRAQEFQLEWDVEWGTEEGEYHYTAQGKDWISLFLDKSSSDEECL